MRLLRRDMIFLWIALIPIPLLSWGCGQILVKPAQATPPQIRFVPHTELSQEEARQRYFFVEYLLETPGSIRRKAILVEPIGGSLKLTLDPDRYVSSLVGASPLGTLVKQFAPMVLHIAISHTGKHVGFAFFNKGEKARVIRLQQNRFYLGF